MRIKHFRYEPEGTDGRPKRYLVALLPIDFGRLAGGQAVEASTATEGAFLLVIDDDAYVEADPYSWAAKDINLSYVHFWLRENAARLRDKQVLDPAHIEREVRDTVQRMLVKRDETSRGEAA